MEKIDLLLFYRLGAKLNALVEMKPKRANLYEALITVAGALDEVKPVLDSFPALAICRPAGEELLEAM